MLLTPRRPLRSALPRVAPSAAAVVATFAALLVGTVPGLPGAPAALEAQAINYPSLQVPSVSERDYTGAVSGGGGTSMMFQWREGVSPIMHLGMDVGLFDPAGSGGDVVLFFAGNVGYDLARASGDQPLDLLLTAGAGVALGGGQSRFRLPIGVSLGHRFLLDDGMALTPFVHPRVSFDLCSSCSRNDRSQSDVSLSFDVGASFEFTPKMAVRVSTLFSGSNRAFGGSDAFAVGLTWTPAGLRR